MNSISDFGSEECNYTSQFSATDLVVYLNPVNPNDPEFQIVETSKEVANFNFTQNYNLQLDYNIIQSNIAAKYQDSILLLAVASKDAAGKVVQYSSTYSNTSA